MISTGNLANFLTGLALGVLWLTLFPAPAKAYGFTLAALLICGAFLVPGSW